MKAKDLAEILLKHPENDVYVADWSEEYEPPTKLSRITIDDGFFVLQCHEYHLNPERTTNR